VTPAPKKTDPPSDHDLGSPYGPQPNGDDEAAGGADSSPLESEPTGRRPEAVEEKGLPGCRASEPDATG
jgi:hypothetical protein